MNKLRFSLYVVSTFVGSYWVVNDLYKKYKYHSQSKF